MLCVHVCTHTCFNKIINVLSDKGSQMRLLLKNLVHSVTLQLITVAPGDNKGTKSCSWQMICTWQLMTLESLKQAGHLWNDFVSIKCWFYVPLTKYLDLAWNILMSLKNNVTNFHCCICTETLEIFVSARPLKHEAVSSTILYVQI